MLSGEDGSWIEVFEWKCLEENLETDLQKNYLSSLGTKTMG